MEQNILKNFSLLLLATILISTSGVLGRYIALPPEITILFRSLLAMLFLYVYICFKKKSLAIYNRKEYVLFLVGGIFMAIHWVTYFYALKLANVALGMLSLYTFPVMISLLEPLILKTKFQVIYLFFGVLILAGLYILTPKLDLQNTQVKGILIGVFSALCYAIRILILKKLAANYDGSIMMFYQVTCISLLLFPILFFTDVSGLQSQFPYILLLALVTTVLGHSMLLQSLKYFSATTTGIVSSLQPVFGIIMAFFILSEKPSKTVFIGGSLILVAVVIESLRIKK